MIKCENISKGYGKTNVLENLSLEISEAEITVLIGPSGSGKTTLLKLLSLIDNPSKGTIIIDNEIYQFPQKETIRKQFDYNGKQQIGVVFQNLNLIPHWTNRENIIKPILGFPIDNEKFAELVSILKLETFIDKYPHQCSRGEQQRIAIVRALMLNPTYIFLDEITSALDPELIASIFKYLLNLKRKGISIFIVTHFLLFAQNVADKIIFLQNGQIIEQGSKEIMKYPKTVQLKSFLESLEGVLINTLNEK